MFISCSNLMPYLNFHASNLINSSSTKCLHDLLFIQVWLLLRVLIMWLRLETNWFDLMSIEHDSWWFFGVCLWGSDSGCSCFGGSEILSRVGECGHFSYWQQQEPCIECSCMQWRHWYPAGHHVQSSMCWRFFEILRTYRVGSAQWTWT